MQFSAIVLLAFSGLAAAASSGVASPTTKTNGTIAAPTLAAPTAKFSGGATGQREAGFGAIVLAVAGAVIVL